MLTEDYIMRMISQALAVLMTALGLKKAGQLNQAQQSLDQALETLLGLDPNLMDQLDDQKLVDALTFLGTLDLDRLNLLADIYRERSEVFSLLGQPERSTASAQRSLRLYLEAALSIDASPSLESIQKIDPLRSQLSPDSLPAETRLALMDYLDRLLASSDDFLLTTGLTREDLRFALSSLESIGLK